MPLPLLSNLVEIIVSHAHGFMDEDFQLRVQAYHSGKLSNHESQSRCWILNGIRFFNVRSQDLDDGPHVARKEKMALAFEIVIESGLADVCSSTDIGCRGGAISLFNEELHGDVQEVVFLETFFLHNLFLPCLGNGSMGVGLLKPRAKEPPRKSRQEHDPMERLQAQVHKWSRTLIDIRHGCVRGNASFHDEKGTRKCSVYIYR